MDENQHKSVTWGHSHVSFALSFLAATWLRLEERERDANAVKNKGRKIRRVN